VSDYLIREDGGRILREDGSGILTEVQVPAAETGGGGSGYFAFKTIAQLEREKKREIVKIRKQAKRAIFKVVAEGLLTPTKLDDVVEAKVEALETPIVSKDDIDKIIARLKAEARRALIRKQQEDDEDDYEVLLLAA
jgi:hypothetical protein